SQSEIRFVALPPPYTPPRNEFWEACRRVWSRKPFAATKPCEDLTIAIPISYDFPPTVWSRCAHRRLVEASSAIGGQEAIQILGGQESEDPRLSSAYK